MSSRRVGALLVAASLLGLVSCGHDDTSADSSGDVVFGDVFVPDTSGQLDAGGDITPDIAADTALDTAQVAGVFGAACEENADCDSGFCIPGPDGYFCTRVCDEECPPDFQCKGVTTLGPDLIFVCLPAVSAECEDASGCNDGDVCTNDICDSNGACVNTARVDCCYLDADCATLDGTCITGSCNVDSGVCSPTVLVGETCDAGTPCMPIATCDAAGTCVGDVDVTVDGCSCADDGDCDDGLDCTDDVCGDQGICANAPQAGSCAIEGACYEAGDASSDSTCEVCDDTADGGAWTIRDCDDANPCTADSCDADTGCESLALADGIACDDGDPCTTGESCSGGVCIGECECVTGADCDGDAGVCRAWSCVDNSCVAVADAASDGQGCDDGAFCTTSTTCASGVCGGGAALDCAASGDGACMVGTCDEAADSCVAQAVADGSACDDGDACTEGDACSVGVCQASPKDCSALETPCATATCNAATGQCESTVMLGQACDDGEACTLTDSCNAAGQCAGAWDEDGCGCTTDAACGVLTDACNVGRCDVSANSCYREPTAGVACDDGDVCSHTDVCGSDGSCGGTGYVCSAGLSCESSSCDGEGGCTETLLTNFCAVDGACYGSGQINPANPCELCNPAIDPSGWTAGTDGVACDADNNGCTVGDSCVSGACAVGAPVTCADDGLACTMASCTSTGPSSHVCGHPVDAGSCLIGGTCYGHGDLDPTNDCQSCLPSNESGWSSLAAGVSCGSLVNTVCNAFDSCDGAGTCAPNHAPTSTGCSDGDACTLGDSCDGAGGCAAGSPLACDDGKACTADSCVDGGCVFTIIGGNCLIDGGCFSVGAPHPASPCLECNGGSDTAWSNKTPGSLCGDGANTSCTAPDTCDSGGVCVANHAAGTAACSDGDACTVADSCDGQGGCVSGAPMVCDDGNACTVDACVAGACEFTVATSTCLIAGTCYAAGATHPTSDCLVCDASSPSSWSNKSSGAACGDAASSTCDAADSCDGAGLCLPNVAAAGTGCSDGDTCTMGDSCDGVGACISGAPNSCDDGLACTVDACGTDGACTHTVMAGSCLIGGTCYSTGTAQPGVACKECNAASTSDWSNKAAGSTCGSQANSACTNPDTCNASGQCQANHASTATSCSDGDGCTVGDTCNGAGGCGAGGPKNCSDGLACTTDTCSGNGTCSHTVIAGNCLIGGTCVSSGTPQPGAACKECNAASTTGWSNQAAGSACGSQANTACSDPNTCNASGQCQENHASTATSCSDGNGCTVGDTCNGAGACGAGGPKNCSDGKSCTSDVCSGNGTCSNPVIAGNCLIGGTCYSTGTAQPGVACKECNAASTTGWSNQTAGSTCGSQSNTACTNPDTCNASGQCQANHASAATSCSDGDGCTVGDTCNGAGACAAGGPKDCSDGLSCTTDSCSGNGTCSSVRQVTKCLINNTCYNDGETRAFGSCQVCVASVNVWGNAPLGSFCHNGFCEGWCQSSGSCNGPTPPQECF